jgi:hypothetical protein
MRGLTLLIPEKADVERDAVAAAWTAGGGRVQRLGRFWDPPPLEPESVRVYGNDSFCLVLAQKLGLDFFTAAVYDSVEALAEQTNGLESTTRVLASEIVSFEAEVRAFVLDAQVMSLAVYEGSASSLAPAERLVASVAARGSQWLRPRGRLPVHRCGMPAYSSLRLSSSPRLPTESPPALRCAARNWL